MPRRQVRWALVLLAFASVFLLLHVIVYRRKQPSPHIQVPLAPTQAVPKPMEKIRQLIHPNISWTFEEALATVATTDKVVILSMTDSGQVPSIMNLYETSMVPLGLSNTLFVSVSREGCRGLLAQRIPCVVFGGLADDMAYWNTGAFLQKMNLRTNYTLQALKLGYSVLQTDTDMVYLADPFPYLNCSTCLLEALEDGIPNYINAGFVFIRATSRTVALYERMREAALLDPGSEDQRNLNKLVHAMHVPYRTLDTDKFMCGLVYYQKPKRYFQSTAPPCPLCVVVHNNWIVSTEAKIYRFKEMGQWNVDLNGYYSSTSAKYVTYEDYSGGRFGELGARALRNALAVARILKRILILPRFQCDSKAETYCPLNNFLLIKDFDEHFCDYREYEFRNHKLVPDSVKSFEVVPLASLGVESGRLPEERLKATLQSDAPAIHLAGDLTSITVEFQSKHIQTEFNSRVENGFVIGGYTQMRPPVYTRVPWFPVLCLIPVLLVGVLLIAMTCFAR